MVSATEGGVVEVLVPIPRVDPATIGIVVDGVDILDDTHLDVDPAVAFPNPGAPIGGTIDINTADGVKVDAATVIKTDLVCSNGVIHVIDAVILPPSS